MGKRFTTMNGNDLTSMVLAGAANLEVNAGRVNGLNVFPVPDGDTGTNMSMTFASGRDELLQRPNRHLGKAADALSKGLLMGARGNSGVILSQLFRGFARAVQDQEQIDAAAFAGALQFGVDTAYKAVVKPVEGTILTVAREAARHAAVVSRRPCDLGELMAEVLQAAQQALDRTPDQLPVLRQVSVVDAGGQGLVCIYEGFVQMLSGQAEVVPTPAPAASFDVEALHGRCAQAMLSGDLIEHGYCTEFMVRLAPGKPKGRSFDEAQFRQELSRFGDSLLVVADEELVKIHIHAERPGEVMNHAMKYGDLTRIKIENMREQHAHIVGVENAAPGSGVQAALEESAAPALRKPFGFVAVSAGAGITAIFKSLGVDIVLAGGQTMNPSAEEIMRAVQQVAAELVFVLPNNSNIVLAAEQAGEMAEDRRVIVIPTRTIPQGMAAVLAFKEAAAAEVNAHTMKEAAAAVRSGQVTQAVRDTTIDGVAIRQGDVLAILDGSIIASLADPFEACRLLLDKLLEGGGEVVTVYAGEMAEQALTEKLVAYVKSAYPETELDMQNGGQPVYPYLFSVE